jgi:NOL1/NOP2/fmu family ribosome biogenesis protein
MIVSEIKLYELLKAKLGEKEAEAFVHILEKKVDDKFNDAKQTLATKEDIARLDIKIAETKVDLIKWMIGFWIAQMAAIIGLYLNK